MIMNCLQLLAAVLALLAEFVLGDGGCKTDVFKYCYQRDFQLVTDALSLKRMCRRKSLSKAAQCTKEVKRDCEAEFKQFINISGWQEGPQLYCDNSRLLSDHVQCTNAAVPAVKTCVSNVLAMLVKKMNARNITSMSDTKLSLQLTCELRQERIRCLKGALSTTCPPEVRRVLHRVNMLMAKPLCGFGRYVDSPRTPRPVDADDQLGVNSCSCLHSLSFLVLGTRILLFLSSVS